VVIVLKEYKITICDEDKKAIEGFNINVDTIIEAVQRAIWRIKSITCEGVDFMERFDENGKPYTLHGNIKHYRKQGYILEFRGIGEIKAFYDRNKDEVQYFGEQEIGDISGTE